MAVDDKGGSDLDVFEGLGKKSAGHTSFAPPAPPGLPPPSGVVPGFPPPGGGPPGFPPPASGVSANRSANGPGAAPITPSPQGPPPGPRGGDNGVRSTLVGGAAPPPTALQRTLPAVVPPAAKTPTDHFLGFPLAKSEPKVTGLPAPASTAKSVGEAAAVNIDMEWDDDDEKTHIFDKDQEPTRAAAPAASPATRSLPPAVSPPHAHMGKQTLLGVAAPQLLPSPSTAPTASPFRSVTPAPPPASSASGPFSRAPSVSPPGAKGYPPPPAAVATFPSQPSNVPGGMPSRPLPPHHLPPPPIAPSFRPSQSNSPTMPPMGNRMEATALVRPPEPRRGTRMLIVVAGVALLAFAVFFLMPHAGQMAVNVADSKGAAVPHIEIYIDGKKQCDTAPCLVPDIGPGSHTVRVEAPGFERPADKAVAVESRKDTTVDFSLVALKSSSTGFKIAGAQPGAKLFLDDREIGPLPQELRDLPPGTHQIKVAGERYAPLEKTITVNKDEVQDLGSVTLKVVKGKATISLGSPGAKVFIVSGSDRRELPVLPISVDIDTSKQWALTASRPGYSDYNQAISFDDGQAEKAYTVTLDQKLPFSYAGGGWSAPRAAPASAPPAAPSQPSSESSSSEGGQAFLNINSIPASSVILDGKPIGSTPKLKYTVSAGTHSVVFVNPDQNFRKQVSVTVAAGETKAAIGKN
jgi:hypothetical protein